MVFIYTLIILFALLLIYQFYSYDIIEGIDQAEIDKINYNLTQLVKEVREVTDGTLVKQLKNDVDTSKNNIGMLNSEFQSYRDNKDIINEMILVSTELLNAKNDAIKSVEYDDSQNVPEISNPTLNFGKNNTNKFQNVADVMQQQQQQQQQQQNEVPFPTTSNPTLNFGKNNTNKFQNVAEVMQQQQQQQQQQEQEQVPFPTTSIPTQNQEDQTDSKTKNAMQSVKKLFR
jgi:hypothetical protein